MNPEFLIRDYQREDEKEISKIALEAWKSAYSSFLGPDEIANLVNQYYSTEVEETILHAAQSGHAKFRVLTSTKGNPILGYSTGYLREGVGEVTRLYLLPICVGRGYGKALLADMEAFFLASGIVKSFCYVYRDNYLGREFYERNGYTLEPDSPLGKEIKYVKNLK